LLRRDGVRCPGCGGANKSASGFCTSCGTPLAETVEAAGTADSDGTPAVPAAHEQSGTHDRSPAEAAVVAATGGFGAREETNQTLGPNWPQLGANVTTGAPIPRRAHIVEGKGSAARRRRWLPAFVTTIGTVALVGCALLGFALDNERKAHAGTGHELHSALIDVSTLKGDNARLEKELLVTRQLSERRADVLRRARSVLRGVDPLLTSVDELQGLTGDIQKARDTFASNSGELVDDLIQLGNYLIDTSAYDLDLSYLRSLIDDINSELATVRSDSYSLDGYDTDYQGASRRFGTRASGFVNSVRALERQLKLVAEED
jgi:hypothetical protein